MRTWILAWFIVAVTSTAIIVLCLLGLARHVVLLARTARQASDEIQPIVRDLGQEGQRASERASSLEPPGRARRS